MAEMKPRPLFTTPPRTPSIMPGLRMRYKSPFGHLHISIIVDVARDHELEVFAQLGKGGSMVAAELEGLCRLASLYLRAGGQLPDIVKQLKNIVTTTTVDGSKTVSVPDSLGLALEKYLEYKKKYGVKSLILGEVVIEAPDIDSNDEPDREPDREPDIKEEDCAQDIKPEPENSDGSGKPARPE